MVQMLYRRTWQFFILVMALFLIVGFATPRAVQAQAAVSVDTVSDARSGSTVDVAVRLSNPSGVAGFQFDLLYDPQVAVVTAVKPGELLPAGGMFLENLNDADRGNIRVLWLGNQDFPGISGAGKLCQITFRVRSSGKTELELKDLELVDQRGNLLNFDTPQKGSIATTGSGSSKKPTDPAKPTDPVESSDEESSSGNVSITTASTLSHAQKGSYYNFSLTAAGGNDDSYTWERKKGSLPTGLTLSNEGLIYGTPTNAGQYVFTLRVSTDDGWAEKAFTLWVTDGNDLTADFYTDYGNYLGYSEEITFKNLKVSQGSMEINLAPEKLPHTMIVDGSVSWINLTIDLNTGGDALYINNTRHSPSAAKIIPLARGANEITFYVNSSGKSSPKYALTIYKL
ncbi:MAG: hypothetical protein GX996_03745 [Firmicutes bacterium]|nr:hypothetical protein [Bacillota bacterium]